MTIFHVLQWHRNSIHDVDFDNLPDEVRDAWLLTENFHTLDHRELMASLKQILLDYDPTPSNIDAQTILPECQEVPYTAKE